MESLVFVLFLTVVFVAWMGQIAQPRLCVCRVRHQSVLAILGQHLNNTVWRAGDAEQSSIHAPRLRLLRERATGFKDSGRGRPLLHLN
ncbi:MAG: hypothetical protein GDA68_05905 [Nitrospira sp. CR2.1]|nr:hypothetical protein [Nitrospira sp. CR2.1]